MYVFPARNETTLELRVCHSDMKISLFADTGKYLILCPTRSMHFNRSIYVIADRIDRQYFSRATKVLTRPSVKRRTDQGQTYTHFSESTVYAFMPR